MSKPKKMTWGEWFMFYFIIAAGVFLMIAAAPFTPWRAARVDTNVGNRFSMERYYYLVGATDQFGKTVTWFGLKTKMQRKVEEYGRPSPLTALMGAAGSMVGGAGPAMGCMMWEACKQHINTRYISYQMIAFEGLYSAIALLISALCSGGAVLYMGMEEAGEKKKKKKKSDDDVFTPKGRTCAFVVVAFFFSLSGVCCFLFGLDMALQSFKITAYYPYAMSHGGAYAGGFGCFLQFLVMVVAINRTRVKKKPEDDDGGEDGKGKGKGKGKW